ncbi:MAG: hypothetical protein WCB68_04210 [Pyrinomonadaceae bacterium]
MLFVSLATALYQILLLMLAQDPQVVAPRAYRIAFENERVRVTRVHYEPHEKIGAHDHPYSPTIYVYLKDGGPIRFTHVGEEEFILTRPPVKAGAFRLGGNAKETHIVENLSDLPSDFLRIELKGIPFERNSFRGRFPPEPHPIKRSSQKLRFENSQVQILHVTCAARRRCEGLSSSSSASLLVALTPARLKGADGGRAVQKLSMSLGETRWAEAGREMLLENATDRPAEFLRIDLKTGQNP